MYYIRCSALISPQRVINDCAILIDDSKILAVGPAAILKAPAGAEILDGGELIAAPGFIDWQLNGGFGQDFTENPASIWNVAARLPSQGVTAFLPTVITAPLPVYSNAQDVIRRGPPVNFLGAQPLGLHFEGPFLNPSKKGAHNPQHLRSPSMQDSINWSRAEGVWVVTLAPELPGAYALIGDLRKKGVRVSVGHSLATHQEALDSFGAGISCATHLFNAMPPLDHRAPGLSAALLNSSGVSVGLIPDGVHVHPAMLALAWKLKGPKHLTIVTDAISALGMPPGRYGLGDYKVTVNGGSARLDNGTLAGSILSMDQAVRNLMRFTGCSLAQAVAAASANVADLIGAKHKGRLRPGYDADLILMDQKVNIMATFVAGKLVFSKL